MIPDMVKWLTQYTMEETKC